MCDGIKLPRYPPRMSETDPSHPTAETVPQALGRLRVALQDAFLQASRTLGLTAQQAELLCAAMAPAAVGDLARVLRCDRSNVSHLVERAAARGLVNRRTGDEDGRVTVVGLTAEGERLAQRFIAELEAQTRPLCARWPDERRQLAVELLNELSDALDTAASQARAGRPGRGTRPRSESAGPQPADRTLERPHSPPSASSGNLCP
jgi:DNA-binding MarR family transcriptional regulator